MAESMRGSRLGAVSYENEGGVEFAPRQLVPFDCPHGHAFAVPFSVGPTKDVPVNPFGVFGPL